MTETSFLDGKVTQCSLPILEPSPAATAAPLKRLRLGQGELAQFYDQEPGMRYLAFLELRAGCVRGNHYHRVKRELMYVIGGALDLVVQDVATGARATLPLRAGDRVTIATGVAHAMRVTEAGQALEASETRFDPADIHRFPLI